MALITDKDVANIKDVLEELAPFTEEQITYRKFDHMDGGDPVIGIPPTTVYVDTETTAGVRELTFEEVQASGGVYLLGDMEFSVRTETKPEYHDRIVYNEFSWKPKSINKVYLGEILWWEIKARKE